jgi:hypothetical protein
LTGKEDDAGGLTPGKEDDAARRKFTRQMWVILIED